MKLSKNGLKHLTENEGLRLGPYLDTQGKLTIGVGHLLTRKDKKTGRLPTGDKWKKGITKRQSNKLLAYDVARFERNIDNKVKVKLNQNQFDALVSFSFNIGNSAFNTSSTRRVLNKKNFRDVGNKMMLFTKNKKLIPRRKREVDLFYTPVIRKTIIGTDKSRSPIRINRQPKKQAKKFSFLRWVKNLFRGKE